MEKNETINPPQFVKTPFSLDYNKYTYNKFETYLINLLFNIIKPETIYYLTYIKTVYKLTIIPIKVVITWSKNSLIYFYNINKNILQNFDKQTSTNIFPINNNSNKNNIKVIKNKSYLIKYNIFLITTVLYHKYYIKINDIITDINEINNISVIEYNLIKKENKIININIDPGNDNFILINNNNNIPQRLTSTLFKDIQNILILNVSLNKKFIIKKVNFYEKFMLITIKNKSIYDKLSYKNKILYIIIYDILRNKYPEDYIEDILIYNLLYNNFYKNKKNNIGITEDIEDINNTINNIYVYNESNIKNFIFTKNLNYYLKKMIEPIDKQDKDEIENDNTNDNKNEEGNHIINKQKYPKKSNKRKNISNTPLKKRKRKLNNKSKKQIISNIIYENFLGLKDNEKYIKQIDNKKNDSINNINKNNEEDNLKNIITNNNTNNIPLNNNNKKNVKLDIENKENETKIITDKNNNANDDNKKIKINNDNYLQNLDEISISIESDNDKNENIITSNNNNIINNTKKNTENNILQDNNENGYKDNNENNNISNNNLEINIDDKDINNHNNNNINNHNFECNNKNTEKILNKDNKYKNNNDTINKNDILINNTKDNILINNTTESNNTENNNNIHENNNIVNKIICNNINLNRNKNIDNRNCISKSIDKISIVNESNILLNNNTLGNIENKNKNNIIYDKIKDKEIVNLKIFDNINKENFTEKDNKNNLVHNNNTDIKVFNDINNVIIDDKNNKLDNLNKNNSFDNKLENKIDQNLILSENLNTNNHIGINYSNNIINNIENNNHTNNNTSNSEIKNINNISDNINNNTNYNFSNDNLINTNFIDNKTDINKYNNKNNTINNNKIINNNFEYIVKNIISNKKIENKNIISNSNFIKSENLDISKTLNDNKYYNNTEIEISNTDNNILPEKKNFGNINNDNYINNTQNNSNCIITNNNNNKLDIFNKIYNDDSKENNFLLHNIEFTNIKVNQSDNILCNKEFDDKILTDKKNYKLLKNLNNPLLPDTKRNIVINTNDNLCINNNINNMDIKSFSNKPNNTNRNCGNENPFLINSSIINNNNLNVLDSNKESNKSIKLKDNDGIYINNNNINLSKHNQYNNTILSNNKNEFVNPFLVSSITNNTNEINVLDSKKDPILSKLNKNRLLTNKNIKNSFSLNLNSIHIIQKKENLNNVEEKNISTFNNLIKCNINNISYSPIYYIKYEPGSIEYILGSFNISLIKKLHIPYYWLSDRLLNVKYYNEFIAISKYNDIIEQFLHTKQFLPVNKIADNNIMNEGILNSLSIKTIIGNDFIKLNDFFDVKLNNNMDRGVVYNTYKENFSLYFDNVLIRLGLLDFFYYKGVKRKSPPYCCVLCKSIVSTDWIRRHEDNDIDKSYRNMVNGLNMNELFHSLKTSFTLLGNNLSCIDYLLKTISTQNKIQTFFTSYFEYVSNEDIEYENISNLKKFFCNEEFNLNNNNYTLLSFIYLLLNNIIKI